MTQNKTKRVRPVPQSITLTVSRTEQVQQYEPVHVSLTQIYDVTDWENLDEIRQNAMADMGQAVAKGVAREIRRYQRDAE